MDRLIPHNDVLALVHSDEYAGWVFDAAHPTQGRRFLKAAERLRELAPEHGVEIAEIEADYFPTFEQLQYAHALEHIERTLLDGESGEWAGVRRDLGTTALRMAGGTILAVEALLQGRALTAVNFAGAKHHAMPNHSSGFCVFNDFAIAARHVLRSQRRIFCPATKSMRRVGRIAILDIDAHHGDGTEAIMRNSQRVFTFSVHDSTIFPGTGRYDEPEFHVFNRPLPAGSDDEGLFDAVDDFVLFADRFSPDMIFIAMGADGHETDPLSSLTYTIEGMVKAVRNVRRAYPEVPILLGGAGGYQPDDVTPEVWARMALAAATPVPADDRYYVGAIGDIGYLDDPEDRLLEPIDEHLAHHAHLFAAAHEVRAAQSAPPVAFVAPADPVDEHRWRPARIGQIRPGDKVRVLRDAFDSAELGRIHNGRVCEVLEVKDGDVICRSTDDRTPVLKASHYAPYLLEEWSESE
jgi:acetoin utilization protein AcuC